MACSINLFDVLTGTPDTTGTWSSTTYPGTIGSGHLGAINPDTVVAGTYVFTYAVGVPPCESTTDVTITILNAPESGNGNNPTFCETLNSPIVLFDQLTGGPDTDGTWVPSANSTPGYAVGGNPPFTNSFNPSNSNGEDVYTFTYITDNSAPDTPAGCTNCEDSALVVITLEAAPDAGNDFSTEICSHNCVVAMHSNLGGADQNGTWTETTVGIPTYFSQGGQITDWQGVVTFPDTYVDKTYTFVYTLNSPLCGDDTSTVTIVKTSLDLGASTTVNLCSGEGNSYNIFSLLGAESPQNPLATYTLTGNLLSQTGYINGSGSTFADDTFTPQFTSGGTTLTATLCADTGGPCSCNECVTLTINVLDSGDTGTPSTTKLCTNT